MIDLDCISHTAVSQPLFSFLSYAFVRLILGRIIVSKVYCKSAAARLFQGTLTPVSLASHVKGCNFLLTVYFKVKPHIRKNFAIHSSSNSHRTSLIFIVYNSDVFCFCFFLMRLKKKEIQLSPLLCEDQNETHHETHLGLIGVLTSVHVSVEAFQVANQIMWSAWCYISIPQLQVTLALVDEWHHVEDSVAFPFKRAYLQSRWLSGVLCYGDGSCGQIAGHWCWDAAVIILCHYQAICQRPSIILCPPQATSACTHYFVFSVLLTHLSPSTPLPQNHHLHFYKLVFCFVFFPVTVCHPMLTWDSLMESFLWLLADLITHK